MKMSTISFLTLLILLSVSNLAAQDHNNLSESDKQKISEDLTLAAEKANISTDDWLLKALYNSAHSQLKFYRHVYKNVKQEQRVDRLSQFLTTKEQFTFVSDTYYAHHMDDFHWRYIENDIKYSPFKLDSSTAAKLVKVEFEGKQYDFLNDKGIQPGSIILLPAISDQEGANCSATFQLRNQKALWTGWTGRTHVREHIAPIWPKFSSTTDLKLATTWTRRGCEIYINSEPSNATVYFNGEEWYSKTNTSAVLDTGSWEIKICLEGYKDWIEKRSLSAGESWTIDVRLDKK
ncbi:MAG: PEGA domain-containing protein [Deltaproteobacteria bacterium]|nr:PEGA domain-containing protein [Deltaproteobacteria bacterium]